ncbi:hypothetical protein D3C75_1093790 [compost metagenome]
MGRLGAQGAGIGVQALGGLPVRQQALLQRQHAALQPQLAGQQGRGGQHQYARHQRGEALQSGTDATVRGRGCWMVHAGSPKAARLGRWTPERVNSLCACQDASTGR